VITGAAVEQQKSLICHAFMLIQHPSYVAMDSGAHLLIPCPFMFACHMTPLLTQLACDVVWMVSHYLVLARFAASAISGYVYPVLNQSILMPLLTPRNSSSRSQTREEEPREEEPREEEP
jgi:hypothetical protein